MSYSIQIQSASPFSSLPLGEIVPPEQTASILPCSEYPMIAFDDLGKIFERNLPASQLLKSISDVHDLFFTPNDFLKMTQKALSGEQKKELLWKMDLNTSPAMSAQVKVIPHQAIFCAEIQPKEKCHLPEKLYSVNRACVIHYSPTWKILSCEGAQRVFGFSDLELGDRNGLDFIHPEDLEAMLKVKSFAQKTYTFIGRHLNKDQSYVSVTMRGSIDEEMIRYIMQPVKVFRGEDLQNSPPHKKSKNVGSCTLGFFDEKDIDGAKELREAPVHSNISRRAKLPTYSILVIEDNSTNQLIIHKMLTKLNQKVQIFSGGEDALLHLNHTKNPPDLIITDKEMPGMNGIEFLQQVRANPKWQHLYCMMWTDDPQVSSESKYSSLNIAQFLNKKISRKGLASALRIFQAYQKDLAPNKSPLK